MKTFSMTHIGRRREMNQDYMYTSENAVGKRRTFFWLRMAWAVTKQVSMLPDSQ